MRLSKKLDQVLLFILFLILSVFFSGFILNNIHSTFAEGEDDAFVDGGEHFVIFYDKGEKLIVKTDAKTVGDVISRAGIVINEGDIVEPGLDAEINTNNFFINIYRARPVLVKDGSFDKYLMTASYDPRNIAREAGLVIYDDDDVEQVINSNFLEVGVASVYVVTRNGGRILTIEEEIPFEDETIKDYNLAPGQREIRQLGEVGLKTTTYNVLYVDGVEQSRELITEQVVREPVARIVAVGASEIERKPLTAAMGRNRYTIKKSEGIIIERQETYYDLPMSGVMGFCGASGYSVREDGVKVDSDGYVIVAANLDYYPRCSVVETSLGLGKIYDTGTFAEFNPEQFDIATDWSNRNGI